MRIFSLPPPSTPTRNFQFCLFCRLFCKGITCPACNAPWEYIYSNARVFSSLQKRKVQKYRCKICGRQWIIPAKVFLPSPLCPFCGRPLNIKKRRKNFDVYKCSNSSCFHREKYGQRYTYRAFRTDFGRPKERKTSPLPDIKRSHFPFQIQAICISLYLCGLSSREVVFFLKSFFSVKISHQTVLNFLYSLGSHLGSLLPNLPPSSSNLLIVDEKYIRCEGRWGYLFTCLNERGAILAQYFSPTRSFAGAYAVLYRALSKLSSLPGEITVVTDAFTCYPPAIQLIQADFKVKITHVKVKGLFDPQDTRNDFRGYKNPIENFFSILEMRVSKLKGFGSLKGARFFSSLFEVWYNHLRPSQRFNGRPPVPLIEDYPASPVLGWKLLIEKALSG